METILESRLFITLIGLLGAWIVGNSITTKWQLIQKRKELELQLAQNFYKYYGEFFAIWKIWHQLIEDTGETAIVVPEHAIPEQSRYELHERAAAMEGGIETTLLKVASEIPLDQDDQRNLGNLRQAFSVARYCIRHRMTIPFFSSGNKQYRELKRLSTAFGVLLARPLRTNLLSIFVSFPVPTAKEANDAWEEITSNDHEKDWKGYLRRLRGNA
ncbi:MAG: hypothetical protein KAI86_02465 [Desulfobacterales bacterium]|nr:hypothetical protein [Desulfobacterales bacterium]